MPIDLGPIEQFKDRCLQVVALGTTELVVARWDAEVFVFRNICPHALGPLGKGSIVARVTSTAAGDPMVDDSMPIVVCPWHRWEFALPSGRAERDQRHRIKRYQAWVEGGRVIADLSLRTVSRPM